MATEKRIRELEAELARWKQDYKDLAMAMARGQGFPVPASPVEPATFSAEPSLPANVLLAVNETTDPFTEARTVAIDAARGLLAQGMKPEDVEAELRKGEEIKI